MTSENRWNRDRWSWEEEGVRARGRRTTEDIAGSGRAPSWSVPGPARLLIHQNRASGSKQPHYKTHSSAARPFNAALPHLSEGLQGVHLVGPDFKWWTQGPVLEQVRSVREQ